MFRKIVIKINKWLFLFFNKKEYDSVFYPCECMQCGWIGNSMNLEEWNDGGEIGYYCPKCGSRDVEDL
jgi:predicted Zn-ribbon and HTH transcriptional regulator